MNEMLGYAVMFSLLVVVYIQLMAMLIELKKVLSQELKCVARLPQSYPKEPYQKLWMSGTF
jgi:hypothetical protein